MLILLQSKASNQDIIRNSNTLSNFLSLTGDMTVHSEQDFSRCIYE